MGGLVLGITVDPDTGAEAPDLEARSVRRLHIGMRPNVFGTAAGYDFVVQEGPEPPAPGSVRFPGSPIVLTRDEPTDIVVLNPPRRCLPRCPLARAGGEQMGRRVGAELPGAPFQP